MSKESLEHLSSLMDGELSRETGLFMTRRLSSDEALCDTWERYHLIRDCIRQPGSKQVVTGLRAKISASLDVVDSPVKSSWQNQRWLKPVSGLAIAASVALMAIVVTAPQPAEVPGTSDPVISAAANQPFVSPNTLPLVPASQAVSYNSNRLNAYLLRHNQMARTAGRQGFVSFVPIVATPTTTIAETPIEDGVSAEDRPDTEATETQ